MKCATYPKYNVSTNKLLNILKNKKVKLTMTYKPRSFLEANVKF